MDTSSISSLAVTKLAGLGSAVLAVLTAVVGLVFAYVLYRFAVRQIKGSLSVGEGRGRAKFRSLLVGGREPADAFFESTH